MGNPNRREIDIQFKIEGDYVASLQVDSDGNSDFECLHPEAYIEFGDDDERGVCTLCGSECDWAWVKDVDEGRDEDGNYMAKEIQVRECREWHSTDRQCYIQKVSKELMERLKQYAESEN